MPHCCTGVRFLKCPGREHAHRRGAVESMSSFRAVGWNRTATLILWMLAGCGSTDSETAQPPVGAGSSVPSLVSTAGGGALLSWLEPVDGPGQPDASTRSGRYRLRAATWEEGTWSEAETVVESNHFFVNWADFPSITPLADGSWVAHWLERGAAGGYDYGVRVSHRGPDGWSEPWTPHEDVLPVEHGFVSVRPSGAGYLLAWLDGRETVAEGGAMTLRARWGVRGGPQGPEMLLDRRICDCCQTDAAETSEGFVVVYRDRSDAEVRDISLVRWEAAEEAWTDPVRVHPDDWTIAGCPVNGPAVAAGGDRVVVAWFTGAQEDPRVQVAISRDGGRSFDDPIRLDEEAPIGRVDVQLDESGDALVSWVEAVPEGGARIVVDVVRRDGSRESLREVARTGAARASGFPRTARTGEGTLIAWTDDEAGFIRTRLLSWGSIQQ